MAGSLLEVRGVLLDEIRPLRREIFLRKNCFHRAFVDAQAAVDAGVGIDKELVHRRKICFVLGGMNAINATAS